MDRQAQGYERKLQQIFVAVGVLPFLLVMAIVVFALMSDNFLSGANLANVVRQSSYLTIVVAGADAGAADRRLRPLGRHHPGADLRRRRPRDVRHRGGYRNALARHRRRDPGRLRCGLAVGICNGIGVALFSVSPFIMTLGMASVGFGIALYLTGGMPVYGMPFEFCDIFGFGMLFGIPCRSGCRLSCSSRSTC